MFRDLISQPIGYSPPWENETLSQRLTEILSGTGQRVAYVYEWPDSSTFRYRVFNVIEALRAIGDCGLRASWFTGHEIDAVRSILPKLSTLVLARVRITRSVSDLITAARLFGVRVLLDCDDLVFDPRYAQTVSVNNDQPFDQEGHLDSWYAYVGRLNATAIQCDGGITTNAFLANKLGHVCGGDVSVIPNFLNRRQAEVSQRLLDLKAQRSFCGDGQITIGYFSGSHTHNNDFRIALDALMRLMDEDKEVNLRIVGFMSSHEELKRFGKRIDLIPLQDWVNLQVKIAEVDISIAPLQLNDFTNCKSELKYFEAAIVGSFSVLSKSYTFDRAVEQPEDAKIIHNGHWYKGLKEAVALVRDTKRYAEQAHRTAERVYARYGWDRNNQAIISALKRN